MARPSLDVRTRTDADIRPVDARDFFEDELPRLAAERGALAVPGAAELGVEPFSIETPAGSWTLALVDGRIVVGPGSTAGAAVRLGADDLADLVNDLKTPMTFVTGGTLDLRRGDLGDFLDWWVVLRSLVDGRRAFTIGSVELCDLDGAPLDLGRSFAPEDDDAEIAHFLAAAGFVHLRGWCSTAEMDRIAADMDRARPAYTRGDGRSWWARTADGSDRCVRMQRFQEHSSTAQAILDGEALRRIAGLTGEGYVTRSPEGNRIEALVKPIGVVEGISDVPWHKDCSLGMHSYTCCSLTIGISVTGADERSGQLRVVAGSHRALVQPAFVRPEWRLPVVALPTSTGDVTVHCSCTMHMAQPPVEQERRVMYTSFVLPPLAATGAASRHALDDIGRVREGSYRTVSQPPGHTGG